MSSKQQAAASSSAGPFLGPRVTGVPKSRKKNGIPLCGMVYRTFLGDNFFSVGPPPVGNGDLVGFWPVLGLGHLEKFWAWAKNRKTQFPGARGTFGEKNVATLSGMVFCNFLRNKFSAVGPPLVGNGDLVEFWPVLVLGT